MAITVERLVAEIEANPAGAIAALESFGAATDAAARDRTAHINVDVDSSDLARTTAEIDAAAAAADRGSGSFGRLGGSAREASGGFRAFGMVLGGLGIGAVYSAITMLPSALSGATAAVGGLTSALGNLVGLLGAIPAGLGAIVGGLGATLLGFSGVAKGVTATNAIMGKGADTTTTLASRTRELSAAQRGLREATIGAARAQQELADAKKALAKAPEEARENIIDLRLQAAQATLSEKAAVLQLQQAQQNLTAIQNKTARAGFNLIKQTDEFTGKTYEVAQSSADASDAALEQKQAQLALQQAQLNVKKSKEQTKDAQEALNEAEKKGIKNSDIMVAALRRVQDAQFRVASSADAIAAANDRIAEAQRRLNTGATVAQTAAYQQAMSNLSETGQSFVKFLVNRFLPAWKKVTFAAQEGLLPGVQRGLTALMGQFDAISKIVFNFAKTMGDAFAAFMEFWSQDEQAKTLITLFDGLNDLLGNMTRAAIPASRILAAVTQAALPMTNVITNGVVKALNRLADWMETVAGQKKMVAFFDRAAYFGGLWLDVLKPLGSILASVVKAATPLATWMLKSMADYFGRVADKAKSAKGQLDMTKFFNDQKPAIREFFGLLKDVAKVLFTTGSGGEESAFVRTVKELRKTAVPALRDLMRTLDKSDFGPAFAELIGHLLDGFSAIAKNDGIFVLLVKGINGIATAISKLSDATGGASTQGIVGFFTFLAGAKVVKGLVKFGKRVWGVFDDLFKVFKKVRNSKFLKPVFDLILDFFKSPEGKIGSKGGWIGLAIAVIIGAFTLLWKHSEAFRKFWKKTWDLIQKAAAGVAEFFKTQLFPIIQRLWTEIVKPTLTYIGGEFQSLWTTVKPVLAAIGDFIQTEVGPAIVWLWQNVVAPAFKGIGKAIAWTWNNVIKPAINAWFWFMKNVVGPVVKWLYEKVVKNYFKAIGQIIKFVWNTVVEPALKALWWFISKVLAPVITWLWKNVVKPAFSGIGTAIKWAWENVISPALSGLKRVIGAIKTVFVWFKDKGGSVFDKIGSGLQWTWDHILKPIFDKWLDVVKGIKDTMNDLNPMNWDVTPWDGVLPGVATGGPVKKGKPYVVGERRPEVFVPTTSGRIMPKITNDMLAGGGGGITDEQLERVMARWTAEQKRVQINQTFNEKVEPLHVAKEIAWSLR